MMQRIAFGILFLLSSSLHAEMVQKISPESVPSLTKKSELVFRGVCEGVRNGDVFHSKTGRPVPATIYTFQVEETFKGEHSKTREVVQLNISDRRTAQRYGLFFFPAPTVFVVGQEYILFLSEVTSLGIRSVSGLGYGKFFVTEEADGRRIVKHPKGIPGFKNQSAGKGDTTFAATEVSLDQFKEQIHE